jgi:hypothetical protein
MLQLNFEVVNNHQKCNKNQLLTTKFIIPQFNTLQYMEGGLSLLHKRTVHGTFGQDWTSVNLEEISYIAVRAVAS